MQFNPPVKKNVNKKSLTIPIGGFTNRSMFCSKSFFVKALLITLEILAVSCKNTNNDPNGNNTGTCEDLNIDIPPAKSNEFRSVQFTHFWGPCVNRNDCWYRMGVSFDKTFLINDGKGMEEIVLGDQAINLVRSIVEDETNQKTIDQTKCPGVFSSQDLHIEIQMKDGRIFADPVYYDISGCLAEKYQYPHGKIYKLMNEIRSEMLKCNGWEFDWDTSDMMIVNKESRGGCFGL